MSSARFAKARISLRRAGRCRRSKRGDLISIFTAGAYGYTMASNYNARGRVPEVLVDGDKFTVIRKRETYEDMVALER